MPVGQTKLFPHEQRDHNKVDQPEQRSFRSRRKADRSPPHVIYLIDSQQQSRDLADQKFVAVSPQKGQSLGKLK
jgi:hypothetical protein